MEGDTQGALGPQGPTPSCFLQLVSCTRLRRWELYYLAFSLEQLRISFFLGSQNVLVPQVCRSPGGAQEGRPCSPYDHFFAPTLGLAPVTGRAWTHQPSSCTGKGLGARTGLVPVGSLSWWAPGPHTGLSSRARQQRSLLAGTRRLHWPSLPFSSASSFWSQGAPGLR